MTAFLKAEWLKLTTTRATYGIAAAAVVLSAFIVFGLVAKGPPPWTIDQEQLVQLPGVLGITNGLFCLILGLRIYTDEFRHGTIAHTTFSDPARTRSSIAKAIVAAVAGAILTTLAVALSILTLFAMSALSGGAFTAAGSVPPIAGGLIAGGTLWAVIGVGAGAVIRQPVPAVVTALLWVLGVESLLAALIGSAARYLPGQAAQVLGGGAGTDAVIAAGVMSAWAAALWVAGWTTLRRRDLV